MSQKAVTGALLEKGGNILTKTQDSLLFLVHLKNLGIKYEGKTFAIRVASENDDTYFLYVRNTSSAQIEGLGWTCKTNRTYFATIPEGKDAEQIYTWPGHHTSGSYTMHVDMLSDADIRLNESAGENVAELKAAQDSRWEEQDSTNADVAKSVADLEKYGILEDRTFTSFGNYSFRLSNVGSSYAGKTVAVLLEGAGEINIDSFTILLRNDADEALYSYNADIGKVKLITLPDNGNIVKIQFWKSGFAGTLRVRIWLLDDGCKMIYDTLSSEDRVLEDRMEENAGGIESLGKRIDGLGISGDYSIPKEFTEKKHAFGHEIKLEGLIGSGLEFRMFGGLDPFVATSQNLAALQKKEQNISGLDVSIEDNSIIKVSGKPTQKISNNFASFKLNKGVYSFKATIEGDISNTSWTGLAIRIRKESIKNVDGTSVSDHAIISPDGGTYKVEEDDTTITLMLYCLDTTIIINGEATIKVMCNAGEETLPWAAPSMRRDISFNVAPPVLVEFGDGQLNVSGIAEYGLAVIPVTPTSDTKLEDTIATYGDDDGNCFIADSLEYKDGVLNYVRRIGVRTYSSGDDISGPFLSENINGLTDGYKVYYILDKPVVTKVADMEHEFLDGDTLTSDKAGAFFYAAYSVARAGAGCPVAATRIFSREISVRNAIESSLVDGGCLYLGGWDGDIARVDLSDMFRPAVTKVRDNNTGYIVRELLSDGDCLFAVCRDPVSATGSSGLDYGLGLLQVLDKNTLEVKKSVPLKNKGTGGKIYGDYLYVMEQMWDFAVYSHKVLEDETVDGGDVRPVFQLNLDALSGKSVQWTLGEYQRIDFWKDPAANRHYAVVSAFDGGMHFFDVTELVTMPSGATSESEQGTFGTAGDWTTFTNARTIERIGGVKPHFGTGSDNNQTFAVVAEYPYVYATSAPMDSSFKYGKGILRGIATIDVSDMEKFRVLKDSGNPQSYQWNRLEEFPEGTLKGVCAIPYEDWSPHIGEGDLHPSRLVKVGDVLISNNGAKGLAIYRLKNGLPVFERNLRLGGAMTTALYMSEENSMLLIPYQSKDNNGNRLTSLYLIGNVEF